jgi:hypothetical protein
MSKTVQSRVCLRNTAVGENAVFGFWISVSFSGNSGVLLAEKDAQDRFQKMRFQHGKYFSDTLYGWI